MARDETNGSLVILVGESRHSSTTVGSVVLGAFPVSPSRAFLVVGGESVSLVEDVPSSSL
jgi:hypothetical protein